MRLLLVLFSLSIVCCQQQESEENYKDPSDEILKPAIEKHSYQNPKQQIQTCNTKPHELLSFAETLMGIPYKYGSADPKQGFDCSGFITYVFNHFNITVPRSSIDFTNIKREIRLEEAKPGDLILFTGTDSTIRDVGHMGIISSVGKNDVQFIHSSSGKANIVTVTTLNSYYMGQFVKIIRVFEQNNSK